MNKKLLKNEAGQIVLILVLIMTVGLAIGIAVVQRSLSDISTSSKVEQSSRAFSAAEAGIEKLIAENTNSVSYSVPDNNSNANATRDLLPAVITTAGTRQDALEYPPLAKEETATVWLADYTSTSNPPPAAFSPVNAADQALYIYWGNSSTDRAALELTLVYLDTEYKSKKFYLDQIVRTPPNNFDTTANCVGSLGPAGKYQCAKNIDWSSLGVITPILIRARLLYNTTSQPFAVQAYGTCGTTCSLPSQAKSLVSTGSSGDTQRTINVFQLEKVVPPYFDYAIFSVGAINK